MRISGRFGKHKAALFPASELEEVGCRVAVRYNLQLQSSHLLWKKQSQLFKKSLDGWWVGLSMSGLLSCRCFTHHVFKLANDCEAILLPFIQSMRECEQDKEY